ncbi:MAG: diguanylate cyclase [Desulfotomaculum sp. BICA1-6]|nr:MAG: diguanylate cyclase [Desulfotomaculum sp. BICA1-6]
MKLAMPFEQGRINQHFGRSREFVVVDVEDGVIKDQKIVSADQLQHNHEGLAGLMRSENVNVVITGGIGAKALIALEESGLKVISGASGSIEEVVASFVRGELDTTKAACCNHHGEHGHGCHHS